MLRLLSTKKRHKSKKMRIFLAKDLQKGWHRPRFGLSLHFCGRSEWPCMPKMEAGLRAKKALQGRENWQIRASFGRASAGGAEDARKGPGEGRALGQSAGKAAPGSRDRTQGQTIPGCPPSLRQILRRKPSGPERSGLAVQEDAAPSPGRGFIRLRRVSKRILGSAGLEKWASSPACRLRRTSSSKALAARAMRGTVPASCQPGLLRANLARIVPEEDGMEAVDRRGPAAQARKTLPAWRRRAPKRVLFSERYATAQRVQSMTAAAMAGKMPRCRQRRRPPAGARRESPGRCPRRRRPAPRKESGGSWRGRGCLSRSPCSAARSC